jgi:hypothetical protein
MKVWTILYKNIFERNNKIGRIKHYTLLQPVIIVIMVNFN